MLKLLEAECYLCLSHSQKFPFDRAATVQPNPPVECLLWAPMDLLFPLIPSRGDFGQNRWGKAGSKQEDVLLVMLGKKNLPIPYFWYWASNTLNTGEEMADSVQCDYRVLVDRPVGKLQIQNSGQLKVTGVYTTPATVNSMKL